jgi:4-hydroxy 2-oxovalerate aldolase
MERIVKEDDLVDSVSAKESRETPILLDVTIRDGGYLNDWAFTEPQMDRVVEKALGLCLDFVEVGYIDDRPGLHAAASMKPGSLEKWQGLREGIGLAVMCRPTVQNAESVVSSRKGLVDLIRIPVDLMRVDLASKLAKVCERNQVPYAINLTNISCYDSDWIRSCFSKLPDSAIVVYIADSRGNLTPDRIPSIYETLRSVRNATFGFHAHNNLGLAIANAEAALSNGVDWIDGSILGIGLGGRNLDILHAIRIANQKRPNPPIQGFDEEIYESDFGVPAPGPEMELFRLTGMRNFKMEWAVMMARVLGQDEAISIIGCLPLKPMFQPDEMRPYLSDETWRKLTW